MTDLLNNHLQEALQRGYVAAYRLLGNPDESHEACQEAAAKALAARKNYDTSQPFYPWFYRILKNHCLDRLRRRKRVSPQAEVELIETQHSAEIQMVEHERSGAVLQAITKLSGEHREVIELRHFQDLSYEEMAILLECPEGTVMSRLYRARKALRQILREMSDFCFATETTEETK